MAKIIMVTGGASSGKSDFAENLCKEMGRDKCYIATSVPFDEEMMEKREKHRKKRQFDNWETVEAYRDLDKIILSPDFKSDVVLLDCVTMMISNLMFEGGLGFEDLSMEEKEKKSVRIKKEFINLLEAIKIKKTDFVFVTNEISLGVVPGEKVSRYFVNLSGEINRIIADYSDEVHFIVSGIDMRIK